jgi:hypothetical protein
MSESFTLDIIYKGVPQKINCALRASTYTYRFLCQAGNTDIILEKDDEGQWRALEADPFSENKLKSDPGLVRAVLEEMKRIMEKEV